MWPNENNFCGGNFKDWLEVSLLNECNGRCSWCIEKDGYRPPTRAPWNVIAYRAIATGKKNIILLGGEPTLYKDLAKIIQNLSSAGRKVWLTTNGGVLTPQFVYEKLVGLTGINISIHDFDLDRSKAITGVKTMDLPAVINALHKIGVNVRLNCNCILGHIDSKEAIEQYIAFAKSVVADKVRFAELKQDDENFVDLAEVLDRQYGLNDDPFIQGCQCDTIIDGIPVNFRQMCGLQTPKRPMPIDPQQHKKKVLYSDGIIYDGWQKQKQEKEIAMDDKKLKKLLADVAAGKVSPQEAQKQIKAAEVKSDCRY